MKCPVCGGKTRVTNTVADGSEVLRQRDCVECKHRSYTKETEVEEQDAKQTLYELRYAWRYGYKCRKKWENEGKEDK